MQFSSLSARRHLAQVFSRASACPATIPAHGFDQYLDPITYRHVSLQSGACTSDVAVSWRLHRPLPIILHGLGYGLHLLKAVLYKGHHTQVLPQAFLPRPVVSVHVLRRASDPHSCQHVKVPLHTCISLPRQLHQVPPTIKQCLGCRLEALQCRCFNVLASQDMASQADHSCSIQASKEGMDEAQTFVYGTDASVLDKAQKPINRRILASSTKANETILTDAGAKSMQTVVVQESVEALEELLKELETSAPDEDPRVGALCLRLAQMCVAKDENPEKILVHGQRALKILGSPEISLECATCLEVIGCAYHKKGEFEKAVAYLERAATILEKLKATVKEEVMGSLQYAVQALLGQANMSLGRQEEALVNFQDAISINERVLEPHDPNLGKSYQQVAEAFMQAQDLEEALTLCLKALPIYTDCYGSSSSQVAELRKLLSVIYYGLDDFEKVLSEHQAVRPILEALGKSEEVASLDLASGEAFLCLDRYREAIFTLKDVVKQTTTFNHCHGQALVLLAKAYAALKEEKNATMYCNKALDVLRNKEPSVEVGASLVELALVFRQLNDKEQAFSTFKMTLEIYQQHPQEHAAVAFIEGQIGLLYLGAEKAIEALPYLERCVTKNESVLGLENKELLDEYNHLGVAYIQLGKLEEALAKFEAAKAIAVQSDVSKDPATITLYNNLAYVYTALGRLGDALLCQQLLVVTIKETGIETDVRLDEAEKRLKDLLQEAAKRQESGKNQDLVSE